MKEIIQKKKDRKEFKESRKEYIDLIHKRGSDIDWKKMDSDFRKQRSLKRTLERKEYVNQNGYWSFNEGKLRFKGASFLASNKFIQNSR